MSAQEPRITRADIAETLQTVRDVAALTLTEPQWAEADAAASAIADALARDNPEALQEALADLELLGPTRLATGDGGSARANLPAPAHIQVLIRTLEQGAAQVDQNLLPVAVYLSDAASHEQVEAGVEALLATAGLTIVERGTPVLGSWFRRMRAAGNQAARSPSAREAVTSIVHAADAHFLQRPDAEVTATLMQNLPALIASLQPTKDAVLRVGAVLIVKVEWTVVVHQLTPGQRLLLDHNPELEYAPHSILAALGALGSQGFDGAPVSLPPDSPLQPSPLPSS
jgi:hypothetical protein